MFDIFKKEEKARLNKLRELVEGCKKHPGYRCKRKPTAPCKRCEELFSFYTQPKAWDEQCDRWWKIYHDVERKRMQEWSRAEEDRLNRPG